MLTMVIGILFIHFVADFCFQTRWMGNNKSSQWNAMFSHIFVYCFVLLVGLCFVTKNPVPYVLVNGIAHLATDSITSRLTKWLWSKKKEHEFWMVIGFDQFAHAAVLIATIPLLIEGL